MNADELEKELEKIGALEWSDDVPAGDGMAEHAIKIRDDAPVIPPIVPRAEFVPLADLHAHPRNYRQHPDDQLEHIMRSIREHGFYRNVVACTDGTILAGHGVAEAARRLKLESIPVISLAIQPNDPRALKILAGDNAIANLATDDDRMLTELLKQLSVEDDLLGTGFDDKQLAALAMITRPSSEIPDFDAAAEWLGMPEHNPGEKDIKLTVHFRNKEDLDGLLGILGYDRAQIKAGNPTVWYPPKERQDLSSLEFQQTEELLG
jgi:hypothetical protein